MSSRMKQEVTLEIKKFVADYQKNRSCTTEWGEPIVGYADICGKCLAAAPRSHIAPASVKRRARKRQKN